jgi:ribosomal-protein-alanine N-acetyltransferase
MAELRLLGAGDAEAILDFEVTNRAFFTTSISDRGDDFFIRFSEEYDALLAEQESGARAGYLLVDGDGAILGRFNLVFTEPGVAEVGYRMAERAAGRGLATEAVVELCRLAASRHSVRTLRAATSHQNVASRRVLTKAGFALTGPADPDDIGGKQGDWFERRLVSGG